MSDRKNAVSPQTCTFVVVGASSGLGRSLSERLARAGHALVLVSSDARDLAAVAADLALRWHVRTKAVVIDLAKPTPDFAGIDGALSDLPPLRGVLVPAGMNDHGDRPGQDADRFRGLMAANCVAPCTLIDHLLERLRNRPGGVVIAFGSIASARGRTRNAAYAAAKRALQSYIESLRYSEAASGLIVQFYVVGYLDTNLSFGQKTPLPRASAVGLADVVIQRMQEDFGVAYYPRFWRPVCLLIRTLPWFVYRRLSF